jgi:hypothetical protein
LNEGEAEIVITYEDCLGVAGLNEAEVQAIAEHERVPGMIALELADHLHHCPGGERRIASMILDDVALARARGDVAEAARLRRVWTAFVQHHPAASAA